MRKHLTRDFPESFAKAPAREEETCPHCGAVLRTRHARRQHLTLEVCRRPAPRPRPAWSPAVRPGSGGGTQEPGDGAPARRPGRRTRG